ncbi:hypothetical protein FRC15_003946 [Serendipita sp. 397]|nr:hypothetical protein FRC15_003946 [Serendipita sp. 397]
MATGYRCLRLRAIRSGPNVPTAAANLHLVTSSSKLPSAQRNYATKDASSSSMSESGWERDPSLPPKPPPGTYPHPFPNSRDDPHSNSMRSVYQHPTTTYKTSTSNAQSVWAGMSGSSSPGGRWGAMNKLAGLDMNSPLSEIDPEVLLSNLTPLYVIHVKASSNNTIITLHATPTPKILDVSLTPSNAKLIKRSASRQELEATQWNDPTPEKAPLFGVESNPDAPLPAEVEVNETEASAAQSGVPSPTRAATSKQGVQILAPPTANRCIGWASGGSCHYKKVNRSTYEAGHAATIRILRRVEEAYQHLASGGKIEDLPPMKEVVKDAKQERRELPMRDSGKVMALKVVYTGFGTGRDAFNSAMLSAEGGFVRGLIGQVRASFPPEWIHGSPYLTCGGLCV